MMRALFLVLATCHTSADPNVVAPVQDASVSVVEASAPIEASVEASVEASTIDASMPCLVGGKPCSPHCASLATKVLSLPPDDGKCDKAPCAAVGGTCDYAGFCFGQACIRKAKDAGKSCTDGKQCESGGCIAPSSATTGAIAIGKCATPVFLMGCHVTVSGGKVQMGICGD